MKKILFLGSSNGTCDMIKYAQSQGFYTIVTDYLPPEKSAGKRISDEHWLISTAEVDELEKKCREEGVSGVLCGVNAFNLKACMELTNRLNLPCYVNMELWNKTGIKSTFKQICKECNAPVAKDYYLPDDFSDEDAQQIDFPVVVKPVDKGANTGISFCNNVPELRKAIKLVREVSDNPDIIIERKLQGEEWFSSYVLRKGEVRFLSLNAMYHEEGTPSFCYVLTTTVTRHVEQYIKEINPQIENVLKAIGCREGYAWVQVMRDERDGKFYIIEMGYRLDSDMLYQPVKYIYGFDVTKAMVDYACGIDSIHENPLPSPQEHAPIKCGAGVRLWANKDAIIKKIAGIEDIQKISGLYIEIKKSEGDFVGQYKYIGSITFASENCDALCEMVNFINNTLHVYDENDEDIVIKYTDFKKLRKIYKEGLEGK